VRISSGDPARAIELHGLAHERCFVANSVNFPVRIEPAPVVIDPSLATPADA
jgi:organic hydroperoxide reductase OsmC/OhrA